MYCHQPTSAFASAIASLSSAIVNLFISHHQPSPAITSLSSVIISHHQPFISHHQPSPAFHQSSSAITSLSSVIISLFNSHQEPFISPCFYPINQ
jgi:hypothetical protein